MEDCTVTGEWISQPHKHSLSEQVKTIDYINLSKLVVQEFVDYSDLELQMESLLLRGAIEDYTALLQYCDEAIDSYYKYHNSVFGILDSINKDYNTMNLEATEIQQKLADPENMALLRDVLAKLG